MCTIRLDINHHTSPQYVPDDIRVRSVPDPGLEGQEVGFRNDFYGTDFAIEVIRDFSDKVVDLLAKAGANAGKANGEALLKDLLDDVERLYRTQTYTKNLKIRWRLEKKAPQHPVIIFVERVAHINVKAEAPWNFQIKTRFDSESLPSLILGLGDFSFRQGQRLQGDLESKRRSTICLQDNYVDVTDEVVLSADLLGLGGTLTGFIREVRDLVLDSITTITQGSLTKQEIVVKVTDTILNLQEKAIDLTKDAKAKVWLKLYSYNIRCLRLSETKLALEKVEHHITTFKRTLTEEIEPFAETDLPGSDTVLDTYESILRQLEEMRKKLKRVIDGAEASSGIVGE